MDEPTIDEAPLQNATSSSSSALNVDWTSLHEQVGTVRKKISDEATKTEKPMDAGALYKTLRIKNPNMPSLEILHRISDFHKLSQRKEIVPVPDDKIDEIILTKNDKGRRNYKQHRQKVIAQRSSTSL